MADRLVTLVRFASAFEARRAADELEASGIPVSVTNEHLVATADYLSNAVNGVAIQVMEADAERAAEVLKEASEKPPTAEPASDEVDDEDHGIKPTSPCDQAIERAFRASLLGLFVFPPLPHLYSVYLLLRAGRMPGEHDPQLTWKLTTAWLINLAAIPLFGWIWATL